MFTRIKINFIINATLNVPSGNIVPIFVPNL